MKREKYSIDEVHYIMLKSRCDGDVTVDSLKVRFSTPTTTQQVVSGRCLCCYVRPPTFLLWNNLFDLVYQTPTRSYQSQIPVAFGIPGHMTTKHLPDTPC